mmetsp:Transcript_897/g.2915  ORF Transcript_897/g.2915 Transcript_897/m.2915 type:complete len:261 (+) Transcript_897:1430-2212(+)
MCLGDWARPTAAPAHPRYSLPTPLLPHHSRATHPSPSTRTKPPSLSAPEALNRRIRVVSPYPCQRPVLQAWFGAHKPSPPAPYPQEKVCACRILAFPTHWRRIPPKLLHLVRRTVILWRCHVQQRRQRMSRLFPVPLSLEGIFIFLQPRRVVPTIRPLSALATPQALQANKSNSDTAHPTPHPATSRPSPRFVSRGRKGSHHMPTFFHHLLLPSKNTSCHHTHHNAGLSPRCAHTVRAVHALLHTRLPVFTGCDDSYDRD